MKSITLRNIASHIYDQPQYVLVVEAAPRALDMVKGVVSRIEANAKNPKNYKI